jgi:hypothetical protein
MIRGRLESEPPDARPSSLVTLHVSLLDDGQPDDEPASPFSDVISIGVTTVDCSPVDCCDNRAATGRGDGGVTGVGVNIVGW